MGLCNDHSTILIERNLEYGLNTLDNLIIDHGDSDAKKEPRKKSRNLRSAAPLKMKNNMNNIAEKIPLESFQNLIPEKYKEFFMRNDPIACNSLCNNEFTNNSNSNAINEEPVKLSNGSLYMGEWNENSEIEGLGKLYMPQSNVYVEGMWDKGIMRNGKILYPNGSIYEGEIENSIFHGQGKLTYPDGLIYEGEFDQGIREGRGSLEWPDGSKYWGEFNNDQMSGEGELICSNGYSYKGKFENNKLEGEGIFTGPNKSKYNGLFINNMFNGIGRYSWGGIDQVYTGGYNLGKKNGKGKYVIKQGQLFKGFFINGEPDGPGKIITDAYIYKGFWRNGELIDQEDKKLRDSDSSVQKTNESNEFEEEPNMQFKVILEDINPLGLQYLDSSTIDLNSYEIILKQDSKKSSH